MYATIVDEANSLVEARRYSRHPGLGNSGETLRVVPCKAVRRQQDPIPTSLRDYCGVRQANDIVQLSVRAADQATGSSGTEHI